MAFASENMSVCIAHGEHLQVNKTIGTKRHLAGFYVYITVGNYNLCIILTFEWHMVR